MTKIVESWEGLTQIETIENLIGEEVVEIEHNKHYKSDNKDVFVYHTDDLNNKINEAIFEEISYLNNDLLKKHLPKKFNSDVVLDSYKELCIYDHTILSKLIKNVEEFINDVKDNFKDDIMYLLHGECNSYEIINTKMCIFVCDK